MRRLLGALGAATLTAAFATAGDPPSVEALVEKLGDPAFRAREDAGRQLLARGPVALPALERATTHPDNEVRARAADLADRLRRLDESARLVAPKTVRLDVVNVPLGTALADLKAKTGIPLALDPLRVADSLRPVTVRTGDVPAWEAVEAFCRAAGLREVFREDLAGPAGRGTEMEMLGQRRAYIAPTPQPAVTAGQVPVVLADGKPDRLPGDRATAVRVLALPPTFPGTRLIRGAGQVVLNLDVTPLPGLRWDDVTAVRVTKAEDETGRPVFTAHRTDGRSGGAQYEEVVFWGGVGAGQVVFLNGGDFAYGGAPSANRPNPRVVPVTLKTDDRAITTLKVFEGVVVGEVTIPNQPLATVDDLPRGSGMVVRGANDVNLSVASYDRQPDGQIAVKVRIDGPNPWAAQRLGRRAGLVINGGMMWEGGVQSGATGRFQFADAAGGPIPTPPARLTSSSDDGVRQTAEYVFTFPRSLKDRPPARLVLVGDKAAAVEVPFRLTDVRLP